MDTQILDQVFSNLDANKLPATPKQPHSPSSDRSQKWLLAGIVVGILLSGFFSYKAFWPGQVNTAEASPYVYKNIEDIQAGDWVIAEDPVTGQKQRKRVLEAYRRVSNHLRHLHIRTADGQTQLIKTTNEHPFWVEAKGWIKAKKLQVGDKLRQSNGQIALLVSNVYEAHPEGIAVFNFQVEDFHTYFVAAPDARGPPVLVHNADCPMTVTGPGTVRSFDIDFRGTVGDNYVYLYHGSRVPLQGSRFSVDAAAEVARASSHRTQPGVFFTDDLGHAIQQYARREGFVARIRVHRSVARRFLHPDRIGPNRTVNQFHFRTQAEVDAWINNPASELEVVPHREGFRRFLAGEW